MAHRTELQSSVALARIDEAACIGCTLCVAACPVDAIVGAAKLMHTVLAERCTGCELCLPPCPVDCIAMLPGGRPWTAADALLAQSRSIARELRLGVRNSARGGRVASAAASSGDPAKARRQAAVAAALARARARRARGPAATRARAGR
jgi:H+/Na+-translocating ferredoxin:NAD+ oxidoreductase subunit B